MKIVVASGGLGNVMFQYAFAKAIEKTFACHCAFFVTNKNIQHGPYCLDKIFKIEKDHQLNILERTYITLLQKISNVCFRRIPNRVLFLPRPAIRQTHFLYEPSVLQTSRIGAYYNGIWQGEVFFKPVINDIQSIFRFDESLLNVRTREFASWITSENAISIHIRRGDYLGSFYSNEATVGCTKAYYDAAIQYFRERIERPKFAVFSDDIPFCRELFVDSDFAFADFNSGDDSWQDMYLMHLCKHNIIANSTFSWWGAYLNANPAKAVIAPRLWWYGYDTSAVIPAAWIKLDEKGNLINEV